MVDDTEKSALEQIAEVLLAHEVEFIVIGGQAELLMGSPRVTYDVDLCYRRTHENLERLARALREIKPALRDAPGDLPFVIDAQSLALGSNFAFVTSIGTLDLLGWVEPLGEYEVLLRNAHVVRVGKLDLRVIDLEDLITIKRHIQRPKDRESLQQLLAIKRIRDEEDEESGG